METAASPAGDRLCLVSPSPSALATVLPTLTDRQLVNEPLVNMVPEATTADSLMMMPRSLSCWQLPVS